MHKEEDHAVSGGDGGMVQETGGEELLLNLSQYDWGHLTLPFSKRWGCHYFIYISHEKTKTNNMLVHLSDFPTLSPSLSPEKKRLMNILFHFLKRFSHFLKHLLTVVLNKL